jgi:hypothetical protein
VQLGYFLGIGAGDAGPVASVYFGLVHPAPHGGLGQLEFSRHTSHALALPVAQGDHLRFANSGLKGRRWRLTIVSHIEIWTSFLGARHPSRMSVKPGQAHTGPAEWRRTRGVELAWRAEGLTGLYRAGPTRPQV